ncbi:hypothetical protein C1646_677996 [Rhizophagus diaphanus]|nr:hypothetical protein C1646_677996 [Rhizophagus diaphanus] [Rhizophagus sp. MUCL 43196]
MADVIETDSETISNYSLDSEEYEEVEEYDEEENNDDEGNNDEENDNEEDDEGDDNDDDRGNDDNEGGDNDDSTKNKGQKYLMYGILLIKIGGDKGTNKEIKKINESNKKVN